MSGTDQDSIVKTESVLSVADQWTDTVAVALPSVTLQRFDIENYKTSVDTVSEPLPACPSASASDTSSSSSNSSSSSSSSTSSSSSSSSSPSGSDAEAEATRRVSPLALRRLPGPLGAGVFAPKGGTRGASSSPVSVDESVGDHSSSIAGQQFSCAKCYKKFPLRHLMNQHKKECESAGDGRHSSRSLSASPSLAENNNNNSSSSSAVADDLRDVLATSPATSPAAASPAAAAAAVDKAEQDDEDEEEDDDDEEEDDDDDEEEVEQQGEKTEEGAEEPFDKHCRVCGKCFPTPVRMQRHLWTHDGSLLPYRCSQCQRRFRDRYYLIDHERAHSTRSLIVCTKCGGAFKTRATMSRHVRVCEGNGDWEEEEATTAATAAATATTTTAAITAAATATAAATTTASDAAQEEGVKTEQREAADAECESGAAGDGDGDDGGGRRHLLRRRSSVVTPDGDSEARHQQQRPDRTSRDGDGQTEEANGDGDGDGISDAEMCSAVANGGDGGGGGVTLSASVKSAVSHALKVRSRQCPVCRRVFGHHTAMRIHMRIHTGERPFRCLLCLRRFVQRPHLVRHFENNHHAEWPYSCLVCGRGFRQQQLLDTHWRAKHSQAAASSARTTAAGKAGSLAKQDEDATELEAVRRLSADIECDDSEKGAAAAAAAVSDRLAAVCRDKLKPAATTASAKLNNCRCFICGRRFSSVTQLAAHKRVHMLSHSAPSTLPPNPLVPPNASHKRNFKCPVCHKLFMWRSNVGRHMRLHLARGETAANFKATPTAPRLPQPTGNKTTPTVRPAQPMSASVSQPIGQSKTADRCFRCAICHRSFLSRKALMIHSFYCSRVVRNTNAASATVSHTHRRVTAPAAPSSGVESHCCHICGKHFVCKSKLHRHLKTHSVEKPFRCELCGHGFTERCNLTQHMQLHQVQGPCKCPHCGRCFSRRRNLATHVRKIHHCVLRADQGDNTERPASRSRQHSGDSGAEFFQQEEHQLEEEEEEQ